MREQATRRFLFVFARMQMLHVKFCTGFGAQAVKDVLRKCKMLYTGFGAQAVEDVAAFDELEHEVGSLGPVVEKVHKLNLEQSKGSGRAPE